MAKLRLRVSLKLQIYLHRLTNFCIEYRNAGYKSQNGTIPLTICKFDIFRTWLAVLELRLSLPPPPQLLLAVVALGVSATTSAGGGGRSRPFRSRKTLSASEEASEEASSLPIAAAALLSCELSRLEDRGLLDLCKEGYLDLKY